MMARPEANNGPYHTHAGGKDSQLQVTNESRGAGILMECGSVRGRGYKRTDPHLTSAAVLPRVTDSRLHVKDDASVSGKQGKRTLKGAQVQIGIN